MLVARAAPPEEVFAAVVAEAGRVLNADFAGMCRYDDHGTATVVGTWAASAGPEPLPPGTRVDPEHRGVHALVFATDRPARVEDYAERVGVGASIPTQLGVRATVGVPIHIDGRLWGIIGVGSLGDESLPVDTESWLAGFTELVAGAIANAEAQAALAASRARIVAAADTARHRIQRDLHDGAQQRLVTLALQLRAAQAHVPQDAGVLATELERLAEGLSAAHEDLREIARGIHPVALAKGGLVAAVAGLARRSTVPVHLDVRINARLPEQIELAAYYVVAETLTNAAKHADAHSIDVEVVTDDDVVRVCVRDDGHGARILSTARASSASRIASRRSAAESRFTAHGVAGTSVKIELPLVRVSAPRRAYLPDSDRIRWRELRCAKVPKTCQCPRAKVPARCKPLALACSRVAEMRRRLAEVARHVGVSEATVSRVLNGRPGVSEGTRQAVLTALDVLGYERPTQLRGERARLVGLVLPELQNPIFPAFADVVGGALAQQGFTPVLCTRTAGGVTEAAYVDLLFEQQVSGVVFAGGQYAQAAAPHGHYAKLAERSLPVVLVNAGVDSLEFPRVSCDDVVAAEQAIEHVISLGHSRIGLLLGPSDHVPSQRKLEGARLTAARHGLDAPDELRRPHDLLARGRPGRRRASCCSQGVTAIVCASDPLALGPIGAARRLGLNVPADVSVVGYDDSAVHALHGSSADHGAPADRGDGPGGGRPAGEPAGGAAGAGRPSCCSCPSSWCGDRPARLADACDRRAAVSNLRNLVRSCITMATSYRSLPPAQRARR